MKVSGLANLITSSKQRMVVGMGATGISVARYLASQGELFLMVDSREEPPGLDAFRAEFPDTPFETGPLNAETLMLASEIVVSPGVALSEPALVSAKQAGIPVYGDIELFAREVAQNGQAKIVAITGSNGKSTVTSLVGQMCIRAGRKAAVGGNLGVPALDLLDADIDTYVLELSSFQLEAVERLNAEVAVVLNISPDHMDRYNSLLDYHSAKHRIFTGIKHVVVNRDEPLSQPLISTDIPQCSFGLQQPDLKDYGVTEIDGQRWLCKGTEQLIAEREVAIKGTHNTANALAALALGEAVDLPMDAMLEELRVFAGLPHRCETLAELNGVTYINDSKATNVGATVAAINGLAQQNNLILIAGGQGKGQNFSPLKQTIEENVKAVVLIGEDADQLSAVVDGAHRAGNLEEAVTLATELAEQNGIVLLSPACASFDMFRNFEERGDRFRTLVEAVQ